MNPKKMYLIDMGFVFLSSRFSENYGFILENIVALELFRQNKDMYYYHDNGECDFVIKNRNKIETVIQVCWEINNNNLERECKGLLKAIQKLNPSDYFILTYNQDEEIKYKNIKIKLLPVWRWLLS